MYHPTRGGVRGGRDQFSWDDVKVDKHRENYLGHSIKAPVGRWQKGKDLHWYTRDKKSMNAEMEAAKEEIKRIKEEEEQAMREALGLAPKRASHRQGNRLDKHEYSELVKRGSTAEDAGGGHAEAARVDGLGFTRAPRPWMEPSSSVPTITDSPPKVEESSMAVQPTRKTEDEDESEDEKSRRKRRRREEKKQEKEERWERHEKRHSHASDDRKKHRKDKQRRRHDSDIDQVPGGKRMVFRKLFGGGMSRKKTKSFIWLFTHEGAYTADLRKRRGLLIDTCPFGCGPCGNDEVWTLW